MRRLLGAAVLAASLPLLLFTTAAATAAPKKCPGKIARTVDGKRTCVRGATMRAIMPTRPAAVEALADALGPPPISLAVRRKLGDRRTWPSLLPTAVARVAIGGAGQLFTNATAALAAAQPARRPVDLFAEPTFTPGAVSVTEGADGSRSASASGTMTEAGTAVTLGLEMGLDATGALDTIGFSADVAKDGARESMGLRVSARSTLPACPDATGAISGTLTFDYRKKSGQALRVGPVNVGKVNDATRVTSKTTVRAQMGKNSRLASITYDAQSTLEVAHSGSALAFIQSRWVAGVAVTARGGLNPATGQPLAGATSNARTKVTSSTLSAREMAAARGAMGTVGDTLTRETLGVVLDRVRKIETEARSGRCVTIVPAPAPAWKLPVGGSMPVQTTLKTRDGVSVPTVDWTTSAGLGTIAPAAVTAPTPTFTITGAGPSGGYTARVRFHAVSPAGVADLDGVAKDDSFPVQLVGTIRETQNFPGAASLDEAWTSAVLYNRTADTTAPDGTRTVLYQLTTATISDGESRLVPYAFCAGAYGTVSGPGTVNAGDVEIIVDPAAGATAAIQHDVSTPVFSAPPYGCPTPPPPPPPIVSSLTAFLYSGPRPFTGFPLTATDLPLFNIPFGSGTMSWTLDAPPAMG